MGEGKGKQVTKYLFCNVSVNKEQGAAGAEEDEHDDDNKMVEIWGKIARGLMALPIPKPFIEIQSLLVEMVHSFKAVTNITNRSAKDLLKNDEQGAGVPWAVLLCFFWYGIGSVGCQFFFPSSPTT